MALRFPIGELMSHLFNVWDKLEGSHGYFLWCLDHALILYYIPPDFATDPDYCIGGKLSPFLAIVFFYGLHQGDAADLHQVLELNVRNLSTFDHVGIKTPAYVVDESLVVNN